MVWLNPGETIVKKQTVKSKCFIGDFNRELNIEYRTAEYPMLK
jgi:hypothetical protein